MTQTSPLRWLPSVEKFVLELQTAAEFSTISTPELTAIVREAIDNLRMKTQTKAAPDFSSGEEAKTILREEIYWSIAARLERVVNGTGIVVHTNLGRSLLPAAAIEAVLTVSRSYSTLEYDLHTGQRGSRHRQIARVLQRLLKVEAALVVNNNAAATFLVLNTLCRDQEAVISRGQLVEIGGSYRMPDVMDQSQALMKEVGTTNKTHLRDYEQAISENTGLLVHVHPSNYHIDGFTTSVSIAALAELGRKHHLPVYSDLGSGVLIDLSQHGLPKEPTVLESLQAGADVVSFSGDKLLGGPQAGIIIGKKEYIERMKKNPFTRMMRCDKMTLAALEATLRLYYDEAKARQEIPTLNRITCPASDLKKSAQNLKNFLRRQKIPGFEFALIPGESEVGGGSLPTVKLPTTLLAIRSENISAGQLEAALRRQPAPIIVRVQNDRVLIDPRTLVEGDSTLIAAALQRIRTERKSA